MAFCNSCGAPLTPESKFCNKCGAAVGAVQAAPSAPPAPASAPPAAGSSSATKVVLLVVAVIISLGIVAVIAVSVIGYHFAKNSRVTQNGQNVKVETPFGTFSANDPEQAVHDLGVDVYPGAQVLKTGSASVSFGNVQTVTANFETTDSVEKVCSFYKSKFPTANVTSSDPDRCTIASTDQKNAVTVNVQSVDGKTKFQIASVIRNAKSSKSE
jgi:hypothetical protein